MEKSLEIDSAQFTSKHEGYARYSLFGEIKGLPENIAEASIVDFEMKREDGSFDLILQYGPITLEKTFELKDGEVYPKISGDIPCTISSPHNIIKSDGSGATTYVTHHFLIFRDGTTLQEIYPDSWKITLKVAESTARGAWLCTLL